MPIDKRRILYEDESVIAIDKLSRELVVKGSGRVDKLPLLDFLKKDFPGLTAIHRLDFETSGVVIFAKNRLVARKILDTKFDQWEKKYRCLVVGRIKRSHGVIAIDLPARNHVCPVGIGISRCARSMVNAKTMYAVIERFGNSTYIEAKIKTGCHHQIRRHFAAIKHPLIMDRVYGNRKFNSVFTSEFGYRKFFLHAASVTFPHPVTEAAVTISAPMPKTFAAVLNSLRALQ